MIPTIISNKSWFYVFYLAVVFIVFLVLQCTNGEFVASTRYVIVDSNITLEVLDWGGKGVPVVLLAGLGHTAHVFDQFAVELTDTYHVIGITRRGFGSSSQPDTGYTLSTLVEDTRIVLDSLELEQIVLAGHSLGGDEMKLFARNYPERVAALVYIEAAYNHASARDSLAQYVAPQSEVPPPSDTDNESPEAYQIYYAKVNGVTMPLTEIKALYQWAPDGQRIGSVTPSWIYSRILRSLQDPDYSGIKVPALAIYATQYPITELFIDYDTCDSATQQAMRVYHKASLRIDKLSHDDFRAHMSKGQVVEIRDAGHSLYITHAQKTLDIMRAFLEEVL